MFNIILKVAPKKYGIKSLPKKYMVYLFKKNGIQRFSQKNIYGIK